MAVGWPITELMRQPQLGQFGQLSATDHRERSVLNASVRTILLSTITDHVLITEYEVLDVDTRGCQRSGCATLTRSRRKPVTETDISCKSFR